MGGGMRGEALPQSHPVRDVVYEAVTLHDGYMRRCMVRCMVVAVVAGMMIGFGSVLVALAVSQWAAGGAEASFAEGVSGGSER